MIKLISRHNGCLMVFLAATAFSASGGALAQGKLDGQQGGWEAVNDSLVVEEGHVQPTFPDQWDAPAQKLSATELEALLERKYQIREESAREYERLYGLYGNGAGNGASAPMGMRLLDEGVPETAVNEQLMHQELIEQELTDEEIDQIDDPDGAFTMALPNPANFRIGRNVRNTHAQRAGNSTLAEPASANNGKILFAAGNFAHAEWSQSNGALWADVPLPGGPADAPILCCDHDVLIDDARRTTFHSALYVNAAFSNGIVRIFVRRVVPNAACWYDIDPAGLEDNILPDYPHIGVTRRFLYLSINAVGAGGGFARMYRINIDAMQNCEFAAFTTVTQAFATFGQRVWVPAEGTNNATVMYWAQHNTSTEMRIWHWLEDGGVGFAERAVAATSFVDPDCRGGTGNFDWIGALNAGIQGFQKRCTLAAGGQGDGSSALACYWQAGPTNPITQGHIRSAVFAVADRKLIAEPHVFNNSYCFGFPSVSANKRGDIGITLAYGGRAGGGGIAVQGAVGLDDEFTPGIGRFGTFYRTAAGVANRSDGRFGDYFTIHPHEPCEKWFSANNYAWDSSPVDSPKDVNYRTVDFGRQQSFACYRSHRNQKPNTSAN
jgi:hypothetical protein